jgi:hypothetical protein
LQQLSFFSSLHCVIVGEIADTLRQRDIYEVLCPHVLWWVQVLPDACRSLLFSPFCFSFTNPGGRELIERQKEKEKKAANQQGLSDPAASYSQPENRQAGRQQLLDCGGLLGTLKHSFKGQSKILCSPSVLAVSWLTFEKIIFPDSCCHKSLE